MKKTLILLITLSLAVVIMALCGWRIKPSFFQQVPDPAGYRQRTLTVSGILSWIPYREYPQISTKGLSNDDAVKLYLQRRNVDHDYDWKVSLSFYGKVVDENNLPVAGAAAGVMWNTVGVAGGTQAATLQSNEKGLFSLTGQHGKCLGVRVEKDGYYTVDGGMGDLNFEYADPSSPDWYEPNPNSPIIFHLRRKG